MKCMKVLELYCLLLNGKFSGCFTSDQEGAAYFGGLEEALMHGVAGIRSDEERKCKPLQPNTSKNQSSLAAAPTQTWKRGLNWSPTSGITASRKPRMIFIDLLHASLAALFASRPPTLEIFPSWPMRFRQIPKWNSQPEESTDSGSVQNTISQLDSESPVSRKASSEQSEELQQGTMAGDGAPNQQHRTQEKVRIHVVSSCHGITEPFRSQNHHTGAAL
ncbi:hypothetical protein MUK42_27304 [Musa troglodytarum]|uniref:Uncharacterized protein n=1 Tax=Musa troglodytarum TaxID=320322 RepID=A0A9E7JMK1_9LILI|nr:hypothetical protein MUK42_27304 [Musa troglodytarum]